MSREWAVLLEFAGAMVALYFIGIAIDKLEARRLRRKQQK